MPTFEDSAVSAAPVEEVWKLLYDPARFPEWWADRASVQSEPQDSSGRRRFTYFSAGHPDFPMPQLLDTSRDERRVAVSCLVSDLRFEWRLDPVGDDATQISVLVDIPERESRRLDAQRNLISRSIRQLAELAARGS